MEHIPLGMIHAKLGIGDGIRNYAAGYTAGYGKKIAEYADGTLLSMGDFLEAYY